jgi:hypothetical protein
MSTLKLSRSFLAVAPALALVAIAGHARAEGPEIARIAPDSAVMVFSISSWNSFEQKAMSSNVGRLWREPRMADLAAQITGESGRFSKLLETLDVEKDDLKLPTGHVGGAIFFPAAQGGEEPGADEPYFLVVADFGEHADDWQTIINKFIDRGLDDRIITTDDDIYRDVKITIIKPVYLEDPHANCVGTCTHEEGLGDMIGGSFEDQRALNIARIGTSLIICNDLPALELAIDRAGGRGRDAFADAGTYRDLMAQHEPGAAAHAVVLAGPLLESFFEDLGDEPSRLFEVLGIDALRGFGASLRFDTPDAVAELNLSILAPEKDGLLALLDEPAGAFEPPAFVPTGAASVSRFSFRFDGLLQVARKAIAAMPQEERGQMEMMLDQASGILGPLLEAMGSNIYAVTTYRQPYTPDSVQSIYAIDLRDEFTVSNTLDFLVAQAGGMIETREFNGNVIYFSEMLPVELAAAVGFGRIFIGSAPAVENALRAAGQPDAPRIGEEPVFRNAVRPLSDRAIAYSYTDMSQWLRWMWWSWENADKILEQSLDRIGLDEEYRNEILRQARENTPEWRKNLPAVDTITRHMGDMVYELRSSNNGFSGRMMILKPADQR